MSWTILSTSLVTGWGKVEVKKEKGNHIITSTFLRYGDGTGSSGGKDMSKEEPVPSHNIRRTEPKERRK